MKLRKLKLWLKDNTNQGKLGVFYAVVIKGNLVLTVMHKAHSVGYEFNHSILNKDKLALLLTLSRELLIFTRRVKSWIKLEKLVLADSKQREYGKEISLVMPREYSFKDRIKLDDNIFEQLSKNPTKLISGRKPPKSIKGYL